MGPDFLGSRDDNVVLARTPACPHRRSPATECGRSHQHGRTRIPGCQRSHVLLSCATASAIPGAQEQYWSVQEDSPFDAQCCSCAVKAHPTLSWWSVCGISDTNEVYPFFTDSPISTSHVRARSFDPALLIQLPRVAARCVVLS